MKFDRRRLFAAFAGAASAGAATPARRANRCATAPLPRAEIDATTLGVRPNADLDQSVALQSAIAQAAAAGSLLRLPPGTYPPALCNYRLMPRSPASRLDALVMIGGPSLLASTGSDYVSLSGLVSTAITLRCLTARPRAFDARARIALTDWMIVNAGGDGIRLDAIAGEVTGNTGSTPPIYAIFSDDAAGLRIAGNTVPRRRQRRHSGVARQARRRRYAGRRQPHRRCRQ